MADSDTLAIAILGGVAVFGISWYLGNKLEDLGEFLGGGLGAIGGGIKKGVINTVEASSDFVSGATGQERIEPRASRNLPVTLWEPPDDAFLRMEGNKVLSAYRVTPGSGVPTSVAFPVEPPREVFITSPDADGVYRFPRVTPAREAGIRLSGVELPLFPIPGGAGIDLALRGARRVGVPVPPLSLDTIKGWWPF